LAFECSLVGLTTGYGNQTRLFAPRLKALGHEVAISAFYGLEGGVLNLGGILVLPRGRTPYGQDIAAEHAINFQADILITLISVARLRREGDSDDTIRSLGRACVDAVVTDREVVRAPRS